MYCPHRPGEHCGCRKPQPGMLLEAAGGLRVDPSQSYLVGDANTDIQAARVVGCRRYMVLTSQGRRQLIHCWSWRKLDFAVKWNLRAAVDAILRQERRAEWGRSRFVLGGGSNRWV